MAISYSYPIAEPASSSMLLGTMIDEVTSRIATKSYLMGDIFALFELSLPFRSLTTDGYAGASTLVDGVLNIPQYGAAPYKSYYARLTQTTGAPVVNEMYSDLGIFSLAFDKTATGVYTITISGHLSTFNNAWYAITDNRFALQTNNNYIKISQPSSNVLQIETYKNNLLSDGLLSDTPLEIKIF